MHSEQEQTMKNCGLCLQPSQLVKSHIIARSLMFLDEPTDKPLVVLSNVSNTQPVTRSPDGVWSRILCASCEKSFKGDDDYLLFFVKSLAHAPVVIFGAATDLSAFDHDKLRRAFVSVLFRAHLSDNSMFGSVDLGSKHYESLRRYLNGSEAEFPSAFSVCLRHLPILEGRSIFDPFPETWGAGRVRAYRFYFPYVTAMIKVDTRPMPLPLKNFELVTGEGKQAFRAMRLTPSEQEVLDLLRTDENEVRVKRIMGSAKMADDIVP